MTAALLWGSLAALLWAGSSLAAIPAMAASATERSLEGAGAPSSDRSASVWSVLRLAVPTAAATALLLALVVDGSPDVTRAAAAPAFGSAVAYTAAPAFMYAALRVGAVALVMPVVATDGALAALAAIVLGAQVGATEGAALALTAIGIVVLARQHPQALQSRETRRGPTLALAAGASASYAAATFILGRASGATALWLVALSRAIAIAPTAAFAHVRRAPPLRGKPRRWALVVGLLDGVGFAAFVTAARHDLPVAAVATSQSAAISVLLAMALLHERPAPQHALGVVLVAVGGAGVAYGG